MKGSRFDYLTPLALTAIITLVLISVYEWVDEIIWPGVNLQQHRFHFGFFVTLISCVAVFFITRLLRTHSIMASIVESSEDGIIGKDLSGRITSWNAGAQRIYGYSLEEVKGKPVSILTPPGTADELPGIIERVRNGEPVRQLETVRMRKDGELIDVSLTISPIKSPAGVVTGASTFVRDISERKRMEQDLLQAKDFLELEVRKRTAELEQTNEQLRNEIQERRHAQEALQIERDKFMGILESMGDGVYIASQDHRIEYLNPVIEREFGPVTAGKCHEYFEGRSTECPRCMIQRVFSGETARWEWNSSKTLKTYDSFATPIANSDGTISKLEIFRDITEQKQAEHALRESEERYRMLFNEANDAILVIEITPKGEYGRFIDFNENLCGLVGYTREELERLVPLEIVAPEFVDDILERKDELLKNQHLLAERAFMAKDGRRVPVEISSHMFDLKGQPTVLAIARDITERKRSEEILRASETKYRKLSQEFDTLLNAIGDTLVLVSPDMKILWANNATTFQVPESGGDMTGQVYHQMFCDRATPCDDCSVLRCLRTGAVESHISSKEGRFLDKRAFPVKDGDGVTGVLLHVVDITEKMAVQAEAMQANHLASLGELAAGVAHEINNPVNGIINYGQVLINESESETLAGDIGVRIVKEGERVAKIVKSLLSFARGGREDKQSVGIGAVLTESLILTQAQIRKEGILLEINVPDDLPKINANPQGMQQVLLNIINNARYALNEKFPTRHDNKTIEIHGEAITSEDREYVRMTFADRGVGISAKDLPILTKPFFSTKPFGKGTGLGLAISERIILEHGGRLAFESKEGEYTRVIVDLPTAGT